MAKTAVGLFENPDSVDSVIHQLEASGFPRKDIRVLRESRDMAGSGVMSTPHTDFEADLTRDLRAFGADEAQAQAYVEEVRRGGVLVFATGSSPMADNAASIMNQNSAVDIGESRASQTHLPGTDNSGEGESAPGRDVSFQAGRVRTSGSAARLFVW